MVSIPSYRAKSIERKNTYVEGLLIGVDEETSLCTIRTKDDYIGGEVCYLHTLSITFPDMIDSQGNKIFASLNEDGKGGDCTFMENGYNETFMWDTLNACVALKSKHYEAKCFRDGYSKGTTLNEYKIIGVQQ